MKVIVKRMYSDGTKRWEGLEYGDGLRISLVGTVVPTLYINYMTLNNKGASALLSDLVEIYPDEGLYTEPNPHLMNSQYWKMIPKRKIKFTAKKLEREKKRRDKEVLKTYNELIKKKGRK